jgi:hypothetical protein
MVSKKSTPAQVSVTSSTSSTNNTKELETKIAELETKLETLISVLKANPKNGIEKLSNGTL